MIRSELIRLKKDFFSHTMNKIYLSNEQSSSAAGM